MNQITTSIKATSKCIVPTYSSFELLLDLNKSATRYKEYICNHYQHNRKVYCPKSFFDEYIKKHPRKCTIGTNNVFYRTISNRIEFINDTKLHKAFSNITDNVMYHIINEKGNEASNCSFVYTYIENDKDGNTHELNFVPQNFTGNRVQKILAIEAL